MTDHGVRAALKRALAARIDPNIDSWRDAEELKLDKWERRLEEIFFTNHLLAQFGRLVMDPRNPEVPLLDHNRNIQAAHALISLAERRSRLRGGDAPMRKVLNVITDDVVQAEIERLTRLAEELEADHPTEPGI